MKVKPQESLEITNSNVFFFFFSWINQMGCCPSVELTRWVIAIFFLDFQFIFYWKKAVWEGCGYYWQKLNVILMNPNRKVCALRDHQTNYDLTTRAYTFSILHSFKKHHKNAVRFNSMRSFHPRKGKQQFHFENLAIVGKFQQ